MGWCSGTEIFDGIMDALYPYIEDKIIPEDKALELVKKLIQVMQNGDWDCEGDSVYWDYPLFQKAYRELLKEEQNE